MNFIRRIGKDEIYIKYVHQLVNVGSKFSAHISPSHRMDLDASPSSKLR